MLHTIDNLKGQRNAMLRRKELRVERLAESEQQVRSYKSEIDAINFDLNDIENAIKVLESVRDGER